MQAEEQKEWGVVGPCTGLSAQNSMALLLPRSGTLPSIRLGDCGTPQQPAAEGGGRQGRPAAMCANGTAPPS